MNLLQKLLIMQTCFQIYFNPVYTYIKKSFSLAFENDNIVLYISITVATLLQTMKEVFHTNYLGVTNGALFIILLTVLIDARYGIKKSLLEGAEAQKKADLIQKNTPEKRRLLKIVELKKFSGLKLQFTFFKCLTLVAYLFCIKHILSNELEEEGIINTILGFTSELVVKVPLIIFWYYDFKSIGNNTAYVYNKKAPIFTVVERIFEPKIAKYFKKIKEE